MAAAGSATNVAKEQRTVFGFSFSTTVNAGRGVDFDGCKIRHMKVGSPTLRKGFKPGWVVVAVDSFAVSTESELRATLDECVGGAGHFYKVHCRVDDASAEQLRVKRRKDLMTAFSKARKVEKANWAKVKKKVVPKKRLDIDLRALEANRDEVVRDASMVVQLLEKDALGELEVLLATATAAEIERFRELLAALDHDDVPRVARVAKLVEDIARRDGHGQVALHHARSGEAADALLQQLPELAALRDERGDVPLQTFLARQPPPKPGASLVNELITVARRRGDALMVAVTLDGDGVPPAHRLRANAPPDDSPAGGLLRDLDSVMPTWEVVREALEAGDIDDLYTATASLAATLREGGIMSCLEAPGSDEDLAAPQRIPGKIDGVWYCVLTERSVSACRLVVSGEEGSYADGHGIAGRVTNIKYEPPKEVNNGEGAPAASNVTFDFENTEIGWKGSGRWTPVGTEWIDGTYGANGMDLPWVCCSTVVETWTVLLQAHIFSEPEVWRDGVHTPTSRERLEVVWKALEMLLGAKTSTYQTQLARALLRASRGPRAPPDARGPYRERLEELLAAQRAAHEATLAKAYEAETSSGADGAWLKALESCLLVDATKWRGKLRTDVDYDALAREPAPAWVASRDFRGAFDALRDAGVVDGAYDLRRLAHGEIVSPRLGDEGTLFLRCDALHRRAVYGSDVEQTFAPIGAVAEAEGCTFSARLGVKRAPRLLAKTLEVLEELNGAPGDDDLFASASCWVLDWLACSVVCADASALRRVYEKLLSGAAGKMIRVKNTFVDEPRAYRDLKVWIAGLGGYRAGDTRPHLVIEVQLHLESFYAAQRARHVAYELERGDFDWKRERADGSSPAAPVTEPKLKPAPAEPVQSGPITVNPMVDDIREIVGRELDILDGEPRKVSGSLAAGQLVRVVGVVSTVDEKPRHVLIDAVWEATSSDQKAVVDPGSWRACSGEITAYRDATNAQALVVPARPASRKAQRPWEPARQVRIELLDICSMEVDAIACLGDIENLNSEVGVLGVIHRAAGPELMEACLELAKDAEAMVDIKAKRAATLPGFEIAAKSIIITEIEYTDAPDGEEDDSYLEKFRREGDIAACYRNALAAAARMKSVAFPLLGSGNLGQEVEVVARACAKGLVSWYTGCTGGPVDASDEALDERATLESVTICVYPGGDYYDNIEKLAYEFEQANIAVSLPEKFEAERKAAEGKT